MGILRGDRRTGAGCSPRAARPRCAPAPRSLLGPHVPRIADTQPAASSATLLFPDLLSRDSEVPGTSSTRRAVINLAVLFGMCSTSVPAPGRRRGRPRPPLYQRLHHAARPPPQVILKEMQRKSLARAATPSPPARPPARGFLKEMQRSFNGSAQLGRRLTC